MTDPDIAGERSVGRAAELLRQVGAAGPGGARLLDLASKTGIARPTVHRILRRLCLERLLTQDRATKRYLLGSLVFELGLAARTPLRRLDRMRPVLEKLAEQTGDTVFLMMRTGDESVCLHVAEGTFPIRARSFEVGGRRPLGTGSAGVALLAALPDDEASQLVARNAQRLQAWGIAEGSLLDQLEHARVRGAVGYDTVTKGVTGVSVVVPTQFGAPYLAVSVAAISSRMPKSRINGVWSQLNSTAKRLAAIEASGG